MRLVIIHPLVVVKLPTKNADLSVATKAIIESLPGNTNVPNPNPSYTDFTALWKAFDDSLRLKGPDAGKARREAKVALKIGLGHLRDSGQTAVDKDVDHAATIAASVKMTIRKVPVRVKPPLEAKQTTVSGLVDLIAKAVARAYSYYWQFSSNQTSWTSALETGKARTTIANLTPGQVYYFRFRALTPTGLTDWSQVVGLIVK